MIGPWRPGRSRGKASGRILTDTKIGGRIRLRRGCEHQFVSEERWGSVKPGLQLQRDTRKPGRRCTGMMPVQTARGIVKQKHDDLMDPERCHVMLTFRKPIPTTLFWVALVLPASAFAQNREQARSQEQKSFQLQSVAERYADVAIRSLELVPMPSAQIDGQPAPYQLRVTITNLTSSVIERVHLKVEVWRPDKTLRSFLGFSVGNQLKPAKETYIAMLVRGIELENGDVVQVGIWDDVQFEAMRSPLSCQIYCDLCEARAMRICGGSGINSYSCSCDGNNRRCSFSCFPPPL